MNSIRSLLKLHEGERLKPYVCSAGKTTIGIGRNLEDVGISPEESAFLFENDLVRVRTELRRSFPWFMSLDSVRSAVVVDMCFNLGLSRLQGFRKFIAALAKQDWETAAIEMMDSRWALQVGARAIRLRDMVITGKWPTQ
jgi:lysozyme